MMHYFTPESIGIGCAQDDLSKGFSQIDEVAGLEKRLSEMMFISRFMGATTASLIPQDICSIAARILYDFLPYGSILFSLPSDFGIAPLFFSPGKGEEKARQLPNENNHENYFKKSRIDKQFQGISFAFADDGRKAVDILLPEKMGKIRMVFENLEIMNFSAALFSEIAVHFSMTLKNSLAHEKVKELATKDSLTGLFNRRVFDELLSVEMKRKELMPVSLLLVDLDDFKKINDNFGHPAGDEVLRTIGKILKEGCRGSDLVARYGGEEFAIMLPATTSSVAFDIAKRLRSRIAGTVYVFDGKAVSLTASIGIAQTSGGRSDAITQLVSRADQALYHAKKSGKNMTCIHTPKSKEIKKIQTREKMEVAWLRSA
jgi:diguanylate cyclase (GGDEF)-like protein